MFHGLVSYVELTWRKKWHSGIRKGDTFRVLTDRGNVLEQDPHRLRDRFPVSYASVILQAVQEMQNAVNFDDEIKEISQERDGKESSTLNVTLTKSEIPSKNEKMRRIFVDFPVSRYLLSYSS